MDIARTFLNLWRTTGMTTISWQQLLMIGISVVLIYLAIRKGFEPLLLIPIGFGGILANIPIAEIAGPAVVRTSNAAAGILHAAVREIMGRLIACSFRQAGNNGG